MDNGDANPRSLNKIISDHGRADSASAVLFPRPLDREERKAFLWMKMLLSTSFSS